MGKYDHAIAVLVREIARLDKNKNDSPAMGRKRAALRDAIANLEDINAEVA